MRQESSGTARKSTTGRPLDGGVETVPITGASPARFLNREISWLAFNERVLEEAANDRHPLLERLKFLTISCENLDEFYMVRVAGLMGQLRAGVEISSPEGLTPAQQLVEINLGGARLMRRQHRVWRHLSAELRAAGWDPKPDAA